MPIVLYALRQFVKMYEAVMLRVADNDLDGCCFLPRQRPIQLHGRGRKFDGGKLIFHLDGKLARDLIHFPAVRSQLRIVGNGILTIFRHRLCVLGVSQDPACGLLIAQTQLFRNIFKTHAGHLQILLAQRNVCRSRYRRKEPVQRQLGAAQLDGGSLIGDGDLVGQLHRMSPGVILNVEIDGSALCVLFQPNGHGIAAQFHLFHVRIVIPGDLHIVGKVSRQLGTRVQSSAAPFGIHNGSTRIQGQLRSLVFRGNGDGLGHIFIVAREKNTQGHLGVGLLGDTGTLVIQRVTVVAEALDQIELIAEQLCLFDLAAGNDQRGGTVPIVPVIEEVELPVLLYGELGQGHRDLHG